MFIEFTEALEIVLELARENSTDERQSAACDTVEDYIVNHLGDN